MPLHTTSPEDCNALEELAAEFQVLHQPGVCDAMRILTRRGFQEAARRTSLPNVRASDEQRLQLYALYKQATVGACAMPPPSRLDFVAHAKWYARVCRRQWGPTTLREAASLTRAQQAVVATGRCPDQAKRDDRLHLARR